MKSRKETGLNEGWNAVALCTAAEAARVAGGRLVRGTGREEIMRVVTDSRAVRSGDLFVAIPGVRVDGHRFVAEAFHRGAVAALASQRVEAGAGEAGAVILADDTVLALGRLGAWRRERFEGTVVAVTGSVGKTTTKEMVAAVLSTRFNVLKSPGNYNTEIGLPLALLDLSPAHQAAVLEMAMRGPGQIRYLARLSRPQVGVVTVIGETHVELLGSVENIARAKAELVEELPPDGLAVLNADDPWQRGMAESTRARVVWYGLGPGAQVTAEGIEPRGAAGVSFVLRAPALAAGEAVIRLPLPGRHHVTDALAAAAVGLALGLTVDEVRQGLEGVEPAAMRSRILSLGGLTVIDDTYNASPTSVKAALSSLREVAATRRVAVLGDMLELGDHAGAGHRDVGRVAAAARVDILVTVGDLAREIGAGAADGGLAAGRVHHCASTGEAVEWLRRVLRPGDTVLVKGSRGMRMEEVVRGLYRWIDPADPGAAGDDGR